MHRLLNVFVVFFLIYFIVFKVPLNCFKSDNKSNYATLFDSNNREIYYWRGEAYRRSGKNKEAVEDFITCIDVDPHYFEAYQGLDYTLMISKEWDAIIAYWNQFLKLEPEHAEAYLERSGTYYHKKDYTSAMRDAKRACNLGNKDGCRQYRQLTNTYGK